MDKEMLMGIEAELGIKFSYNAATEQVDILGPTDAADAVFEVRHFFLSASIFSRRHRVRSPWDYAFFGFVNKALET
jgi:hypothetical protein